MSSIQVNSTEGSIKSLVTNDERKLKISTGNSEKNSSTHVNEERSLGLSQVKSKFALFRFGKSKSFITANSHYLNRILVTFEIEMSFLFYFSEKKFRYNGH